MRQRVGKDTSRLTPCSGDERQKDTERQKETQTDVEGARVLGHIPLCSVLCSWCVTKSTSGASNCSPVSNINNINLDHPPSQTFFFPASWPLRLQTCEPFWHCTPCSEETVAIIQPSPVAAAQDWAVMHNFASAASPAWSWCNTFQQKTKRGCFRCQIILL